MAVTIEELVIEVRANTANAQKGLAEMQRQVAALDKSNQQLQAGNTKLQDSLDKVGKASQQTANHMQRAAAAARTLDRRACPAAGRTVCHRRG